MNVINKRIIIVVLLIPIIIICGPQESQNTKLANDQQRNWCIGSIGSKLSYVGTRSIPPEEVKSLFWTTSSAKEIWIRTYLKEKYTELDSEIFDIKNNPRLNLKIKYANNNQDEWEKIVIAYNKYYQVDKDPIHWNSRDEYNLEIFLLLENNQSALILCRIWAEINEKY